MPIFLCFLICADFPLQFWLGTGHSNFTVDWREYSVCIPRGGYTHSQVWFQVILVPVNVENNQEEWKKKTQGFTTDYSYEFSQLDSAYAYKAIVALQSGASEF